LAERRQIISLRTCYDGIVDILKQGVTPIGVAFLFCSGVMNMKKRKKKRKEKLRRRELLDLMGVHRDTYKRVRGEIRRK
jgi:hypothetical protein